MRPNLDTLLQHWSDFCDDFWHTEDDYGSVQADIDEIIAYARGAEK